MGILNLTGLVQLAFLTLAVSTYQQYSTTVQYRSAVQVYMTGDNIYKRFFTNRTTFTRSTARLPDLNIPLVFSIIIR